VELVVFVLVAQAIGILNTIGLLILSSVVGFWVCKRAGLSVFRRMQQTVAEGNMPHREVVDGFLVLVAGVLLVVPGFVTAFFGALLLLPPVRVGVRTLLIGSFAKRGAIAVRFVDGMGGIRTNRGVRDVTSREANEPRPNPPPELTE
jgi:UPF0716 protein FxsA